MATFEDTFFFNETNRLVGSGGELLIKRGKPTKSPLARMEVGDRLIGIGATHFVESLSRAPGPDSFRSFETGVRDVIKKALRGFAVDTKVQTKDGYEFTFSPLSPQEYSSLLAEVSDDAIRIDPDSIPKGTIIISFTETDSKYTIRSLKNSPRANWAYAVAGQRHWYVGIGKQDDFWWASFPSDRVGLLTRLSPTERLGTIRFGLSLLPGSQGVVKLKTIKTKHPSGKSTKHHFCLQGYATGTKGLRTPFPIGLRTEILFHPIR